MSLLVVSATADCIRALQLPLCMEGNPFKNLVSFNTLKPSAPTFTLLPKVSHMLSSPNKIFSLAKACPNLTMGLEHGKTLMGSSQVNREDSSSKNLAELPNSSTGMASQETGQLLPNRQYFNHRTHADSSMKIKGRDDSRKTHETMNCDGKENSSDNYSSNLSQRTATGGTQENVWSDGSDTWNLSGGKQKLSGQPGQKNSWSSKISIPSTGKLGSSC